jgi:hypothetical protein
MQTHDGSNDGIPYFESDEKENGQVMTLGVDIKYTRPDGSTYWLPLHMALRPSSDVGLLQKYFGDRWTVNLAGYGGVGPESAPIIGFLTTLKPPLGPSLQLYVGTDKDGTTQEIPEF